MEPCGLLCFQPKIVRVLIQQIASRFSGASEPAHISEGETR